MSTDVVRAVIRMHGGAKFYRGAPKAARNYVERDCARYDDYYLAEGDGIAMRFVAEATPAGDVAIEKKPGMDGETRWAAPSTPLQPAASNRATPSRSSGRHSMAETAPTPCRGRSTT